MPCSPWALGTLVLSEGPPLGQGIRSQSWGAHREKQMGKCDPGLPAKPCPEIKSQTLPWVLPAQVGARGAMGTISVMWAVPRSSEVRGGVGGRPQGERGS